MRKMFLAVLFTALLAGGCMRDDNNGSEVIKTSAESVFVINEGSFGGANATVSSYDTKTKESQDGIFYRANAARLGDTAQSMTIHNDVGYLIVNGSKVVYSVNTDDFTVKGKITGLTSPRFTAFAGSTKGYISDLYGSSITIFNPTTMQTSGTISTEGHKSTEQMVVVGDKMFVNCWSMDRTILVIDITTDKIVKQIETGIQPYSIVVDANGMLWCLCDGGGWDGNPTGYEAPTLLAINTKTYTVERTFTFTLGDYFSPRLALSADRKSLYFYNKGIYKMSVDSKELPAEPFIADNWKSPYGLGVDPYNGDIYLADALTYDSPGKIFRYSAKGEKLDEFVSGICPSGFCFK